MRQNDEVIVCTLTEYVTLHLVAGFGGCVPHFYGYFFQFSTTESYMCDHAWTPGCNAVSAGHIPCRQVVRLPFKIKQTRDYFKADRTSFPMLRRGTNLYPLKIYNPKVHARA